MGRWRTRRALVVLLLIVAFQAVIVSVRSHRVPFPYHTFHEFDTTLARTVKVMRGEAWAKSLPIAELVPNTWYGYGPPQMWAAVPGNSDDARWYKKQQPLYFLLAGGVPAAVGLGPASMRMGPFLLLWVLAGLAAWTAHRVAGARGLLASGVLVLLVPAGWQSAVMSMPGLGMMVGAGLVMAAVVASDRLRNPIGAAVVGVAAAATSWMGESAGDAVQALAVVGPTVVVGGLWGVVARGRLRERLQALVGTAVALWVLRQCIDLPWIMKHTRGYILSEASGGRQMPDLLSFLSTVPAALGANLWYGYGETLAGSLLAPVGAGVVGLGVVAGLVGRHRLAVVWALSGSTALLILLSMPDKAHDYYALAALPGLLVAAAMGLTSLRRLGSVVLGAAGVSLAVVMATVVHLDIPTVRVTVCSPVAGWLLLQDSMACGAGRPQPKIRPSFRIAREVPGSTEEHRLAVARSLAGPSMQGVLAEVPADGMIWVLGGSRAPIDLAEVVLLTHRSDVLVQGVAGIADTWSKRVDPGAPEEWVLLLGEVRTGALSARSWPAFVGQVEDMGGTELFRIGKLSAR
ncbi:MAG: hypothetical protein CL927_01765 [Deltaproteobacteria bacterium]|nr:hypothetical protein [Deltaproteobacteria bacterium]HCH62918.1 hypothetical protein [Deltaproteobacteria bacterium]